MEIWNYHAVTRELVSAGVADPDPLEEGNWLIPADATTIAPPSVPAQKAAVFNDGAWSLVPDHRGETWWIANGQSVVIKSLGDPSLDDLHAEEPAPSAEQLSARVNVIRATRLAAGFADAVTGKTWQCDDGSITKWNALASSAGLSMALNINPAPVYQLIPADNSVIELTALATFMLFNARVMPWVSETIIYARSLKDQIIAGGDPDIEIGWP